MNEKIFISYAREDFHYAERLAATLSTIGWSVWWDRRIRPGLAFDRVIEDALAAASVVIVLWSKASVASDWVRAEANYGLRTGKLVPVVIDVVLPPLRFQQIQTPNIAAWDGTENATLLDGLKDELAERLGAPTTDQLKPQVGEKEFDQFVSGVEPTKSPQTIRAPAPSSRSKESVNPTRHIMPRRVLRFATGFGLLFVVLAGLGSTVGPPLYQRVFDESQQLARQAQQKAAEETAAQQKAADEAAARRAQQKTAEETAVRQAQQKAAEEAAARRVQQKTAEETAARQVQQKAADEAAARQVQQKATDEAATRRAQQNAADEAATRQGQQKAADEETVGQSQRNATDEVAARQAQRKAAEEAAAQQAEQAASQIGPQQVAEAQRLLTSMALDTGGADGQAGPRTRQMVRAFQSAMGDRPTGEITLALMGLLRGPPPSAAGRATSLFALAIEARREERVGDAIRLYEAALRLAPKDPDGLLALGDLRRDQKDYDAARRSYEAVQRNGGPAAGIARQRLAALPPPTQATDAQPKTVTAPAGLSSPSQVERPTIDVANGEHLTSGTNDVPSAAGAVGAQASVGSSRPIGVQERTRPSARSSTCAVSAARSQLAANAPQATGTIRMNNDGGWCWYYASAYRGSLLLLADAYILSSAPAHGKVTLTDSGEKTTRIAYRPDPGFTGTDTFVIHVKNLEADRTYTVTVLP